eukprot:CAMPEP_0118896370 /NCGR_PEP_ID=MMETSP1166-20130328/4273_1 /TAXON_ID=1104430 /ORGANISM="Chrysoreinhardia sp, Strain CCMP3193" /LENGTH=273 /DNA_ID=CAMNT_0006835427 /DNA_START=20 /DNA_END=841 /DNA_ORIENTATION=-
MAVVVVAWFLLMSSPREALGLQEGATSRRSMLEGFGRAAAAASSSLALPCLPAFGDDDVIIPSIASQPSWSLLLPVVDLQGALASWARSGGEFPEEAFKALTKGGIFSGKNYIFGCGTRYANLVKYDDIDKALVRSDQNARFNLLFEANKLMDEAKDVNTADASKLGEAASKLDAFLARAPAADVREARRVIRALKDADADNDGSLSKEEYVDAKLSDFDRIVVVWGVFGTTLAQDFRPRYEDTVKFDVLSLDGSLVPNVPDDLKGGIAMSSI